MQRSLSSSSSIGLRGRTRRNPRVDEKANHQRLYTILLGKADAEEKSTTKGATERAVPPTGSALASARDDSGVVAAGASGGAGEGTTKESPKGKPPTVSYAEDVPALSPQEEEHIREREKAEFVAQVCSDSTRLDVRDWVGRIYKIVKVAAETTAEEEDRKKDSRRRRAWNSSSSESSGTTTLVAAGGSIARTDATSRRAPSLISAESLVVNPPRPEPLSTEERLRAYLRGEIPELSAHVHAHVAAKSEEMRRMIDEEDVEKHLMQMRKRAVFDGKTNFLRWQATRRVILQQRLDEAMPHWIEEAVASWNQKAAMRKRDEEIADSDLIFDYLTKRAAHINTNKLASEIPIFKTMHASYSMPTMWRDKYL